MSHEQKQENANKLIHSIKSLSKYYNLNLVISNNCHLCFLIFNLER